MKRRDWTILLVILALALLCFAGGGGFRGSSPRGQARLRVLVGGRETANVALDREETLEICQEDGSRNVVRLAPGAFWMTESNCPNQDCLRQGKVAVDDAGRRALGGQIVCLPHQTVLELYWEDEEAAVRLEVQP